MTNKQQRDWQKKNKSIACENLGITETQYNHLRLIGNKLNLLYTRQCNGYTQEYFEKKDLEREDYLTASAIKYAQSLGLVIFFQTDPRGATIYLSKTPMDQSNYDRGYCIY